MGENDGREQATVCAPGRVRRVRTTDPGSSSDDREASQEESEEKTFDEGEQVPYLFDYNDYTQEEVDAAKEGKSGDEAQNGEASEDA